MCSHLDALLDREIERLLAFLPRPVYDEVVKEFFEAAGQEC